MQTTIHILANADMVNECADATQLSLIVFKKQTGGNKLMNLPTQIMALINVKHAELNSWIFLQGFQRFCSLHQGTAKPPIQVELATFGQKSGRCEVSALACLKLPGKNAEGLVDWKHQGQKKWYKVLNMQGSSDVHT